MIGTITQACNTGLAFFGFGLCHQFPERSYDFGGVLWSVCARCSGIYVGLVLALLALHLAYRKLGGGGQRHGMMYWPYWIFLAAGLAFMGWDGVSSYAGWRETTNFLRWITGIGMGASLAPLLYYLLVNNLAKESVDEPVMGGGVRPWLYVAASMLLSFILVYPLGPVLGVAGALFAALCMWLTFALLLLSLLGVAKPFYRRVAGWRDLVLPGALAMILALVLIVGLSLLNGFQLATLGA